MPLWLMLAMQTPRSVGAASTVTAPNGGEIWPIGSPRVIQWSSSGLSGNVKIEVSRNGGTSWALLRGNAANTGTFNWTVTGPAATQTRIRITSLTDPSVADASNANATIGGGSLAVTSPNGGEIWPIGSLRAIQWTSSGFTGNVKNGAAANTGSFNWTVTGPATSQARIRITSASDPTATDTTNANATLGGGSLALAFPNGGESWPIGSHQTVQWSSAGLTGNVKIEVSRNGGTSWAAIATSTPNDGAYLWTVTGPATSQARIRITSLTDLTVADASSANFTIQ